MNIGFWLIIIAGGITLWHAIENKVPLWIPLILVIIALAIGK